jgi:predicted site-specific integrase-resolvase
MKSIIFVRIPSPNNNVNQKSPQEKFIEGINELPAKYRQEVTKEGMHQHWENKNRKAVGYVRVSTQTQQDKLEKQKQSIQEFATAKGFEIIDFFEDYGSTTNDTRQGFEEMLNYLENNRGIDHVITTEYDRLCRKNHSYNL